MNLKDTYNKIALDWDKDHLNDDWWNKGTVKFTAYLKAGDKILDVGCAGGLKSKFFAEKGFDVVGIDLSEKMIEIAKQRLPDNKFYVKNIAEPLNLDNEFDAVFAQAVLLHIPQSNLEKVLQNLLGALKIGGYFYLAVKEKRPEGLEEEIVKEKDYGYEYERFFSYYTIPELHNYLKNVPVKIVFEDVTLSGKTKWIQIISQKVHG